MPETLVRPDYRLADNLAAASGVVFLTGTQALIRLPLMQAARDAAFGIQSQGFISGYRGSPLGMVDQQAWKAAKLLDQAGVKFLPAINEELGATAVLGTQRVESDPERTADGVFAMWYGKGPGVDRGGDALKHGNAYGSSPHGGVLVVAGDDHGCVSSSMPHQSDVAMQSWHMPVVAPASVAGACRAPAVRRTPSRPTTRRLRAAAAACSAHPAHRRPPGRTARGPRSRIS